MPSFYFSKRAFVLIFLLLFIFLSIIGVVLISTNQQAVNDLVRATLDRQARLTQAGADNIESFLTVAGRSVVLLSQSYDLLNQGETRQTLLDQYVKNRLETPVVGVVLTDAKGKVVANASRDFSSAVGIDLSDRDYFRWAQTASPNTVYLTKPTISRLGVSKNKSVLLIAAPVFREDKFYGVVVISTILDMFGNSYLKTVFPEPFAIYLLDSQGIILSAPNDMSGLNIFEILKENPFFGSELLSDQFEQVIASDQAGGITGILPQGRDNTLTRTLISYAPIHTPDGSQSWRLIVTSPESSIVSLTAPIYIQEISLLVGIFFLVLLIFVLIFSKVRVHLV